MRKILDGLLILFSVYVVASAFKIILVLGEWTGRIKVFGKENLPSLDRGLLVFYNHPDLLNCMLEIFFVPVLLFWKFARHPFRHAPHITLDHNNFKRRWYFWGWLGSLAIPIKRNADKASNGVGEFKQIMGILSRRGLVIHAPGGGRDCTGTQFYENLNGKLLRKFRPSVGSLVSRSDTPVLLVWLEMENLAPKVQPGKRLFSFPPAIWLLLRHRIVITIMKPIGVDDELRKKDPREIPEILASRLLSQASPG